MFYSTIFVNTSIHILILERERRKR